MIALVMARFGFEADAAVMFDDQRVLVGVYEGNGDFAVFGMETLGWWLAANPDGDYEDAIELQVTHAGVLAAFCDRARA